MKIDEYWVGWIDILGYSDIMLSSASAKKEELLKFQLEIVEGREEKYTQNEVLPGRALLSDTLIYYHKCNSKKLSIPPEISIIHFAMNRFDKLLSRGFACRGSITKGKCYIKDGRAFGEGLAKASKLENSTSLPRIIVDTKIIKNVKNNIEKWIDKSALQEIEGKYYLDSFGRSFAPKNGKSALEIRRESIDVCMKRIKEEITINKNNPKVLGKWSHLQQYVQGHLNNL